MKILYFSRDPANRYWARLWSNSLGLRLRCDRRPPRRQASAARVHIYDLDFLWDDKSAVVERLLAESRQSDGLAGTVIVHSYNLAPAEIRTLRAAGVLVARRLTRKLLGITRRSGFPA